MAETFTLPKRFTKEWFGYVWDYYKYHIIVGIIAVILAVFTVFEIVNTKRYDANVNFVSRNVLTAEQESELSEICEKASEDIDNNDEINVSVSQINFTDSAISDTQLYTALQTKLTATFTVDDEFIYIMDKAMMIDVVNLDSAEGIFIPVSEWAEGNFDGEMYGVSLKDNKFMKEIGVDSSNMYLMVRTNYKPENKKLEQKEQNAIKIANFLLK